MKDLRAHLDDGPSEAGVWAIPDEHNLANLELRVLASVVHPCVVPTIDVAAVAPA